jgi:Holliday junction resolvase RusA-like endonuclease
MTNEDKPSLSGIAFWVFGTPIAKQSFRYAAGGGYRDPRVSAWQAQVAAAAREAKNEQGMLSGNCDMLTGDLAVELRFYMPNRRRVDVDNLSKAVLDGLTDILFDDDAQVVDLHAVKAIDSENPRVYVSVRAVGRI